MGGEKFARGFFGVLTSDAGDEDGNVGLRLGHHARRDFPKRRGFFFHCEANQDRHFVKFE
jgi:hypothetical protein